MHEFSLAMNIVNIAEKEVKKAKAEHVTKINLLIGDCAGVEMSSFEFAWPLATRQSVLEKAKMNIKKIRGKALCRDCNTNFDLEQLYDPCPVCGSFSKDIYQGKEFLVESITVI